MTLSITLGTLQGVDAVCFQVCSILKSIDNFRHLVPRVRKTNVVLKWEEKIVALHPPVSG